MGAIATALASAFRAHGWEVSTEIVLEGKSGAVHTVPLLCESEDAAIIVWADLGQHEEPSVLVQIRDDVGADHLVIAGHHIDGDRVTCWDREQVVQIIGQAALKQDGFPVDGLPIFANPIPTTVGDALPDAFAMPFDNPVADDDANHAPEPAPTMDFDIGGLADALAPEPLAADTTWEAPDFEPAAVNVPESVPETTTPPATGGAGLLWDIEEKGAAAPLPDAPRDDNWDLSAPEPEVSMTRLPVLVTPKQAKAAADEHLLVPEGFALVLQPIHLYDVEVDVLQEGSLDANAEYMRVQLNGTDKTITSIDPHLGADSPDLLPPDLNVEVIERNLRVKPERAIEEVHRWVIAAFTREVEVASGGDDDGYAYTERRRVQPRPDQVRITELGVYLRPIWRLQGQNGTVDVDAMTGESLHSEMRSYPDAVELI